MDLNAQQQDLELFESVRDFTLEQRHPQVDYPQHRHQAEEIYILPAGSAEFSFDGSAAQIYRAGDVAHVESNRRHGFHTADESLVVFYLWQAVDLRQTSSFE